MVCGGEQERMLGGDGELETLVLVVYAGVCSEGGGEKMPV